MLQQLIDNTSVLKLHLRGFVSLQWWILETARRKGSARLDSVYFYICVIYRCLFQNVKAVCVICLVNISYCEFVFK